MPKPTSAKAMCYLLSEKYFFNKSAPIIAVAASVPLIISDINVRVEIAAKP